MEKQFQQKSGGREGGREGARWKEREMEGSERMTQREWPLCVTCSVNIMLAPAVWVDGSIVLQGDCKWGGKCTDKIRAGDKKGIYSIMGIHTKGQ